MYYDSCIARMAARERVQYPLRQAISTREQSASKAAQIMNDIARGRSIMAKM